MSKRAVGVAAASVILLLVCGVAAARGQKVGVTQKPGVSKDEPAPATRYEQQLKAIREKNQAERDKLGLDPNRLRAQYPDPEIKLLNLVLAVPGGTVEVVSTGKFQPGVQGVFLTDSVDLLRESATATEYRATVKVSPAALPSLVRVRILAPVSGLYAEPRALYVGGKYEWNLKADNGVAVKLTTTDDGFSQKPGGYSPEQLGYVASSHRAEFFRSGEAKPYEVRDATVKVRGAGEYECSIDQPDAGPGNTGARKAQEAAEQGQERAMAEMQKLSLQMAEAATSGNTKEMLRLQALVNELTKKVTADAMTAMKAETDAALEGTCTSLALSVKAGRVEGELRCGSQQLRLTGTLKFVGQ